MGSDTFQFELNFELPERVSNWGWGLSTSELDYLRGPIIQPDRTSWEFPERLKTFVTQARWIQIKQDRDDEVEVERASLLEALGYVTVKAQEAPLDSDWVDILCWLTQEVMPHIRQIDQPVHQIVGESKPLQLTKTQADDLWRLRLWIRKMVEKNCRK